MSLKRIDRLIEAAQSAVDGECDLKAIYEWKQQTLEYLMNHLGRDHYYTEFYTNYLKGIEQKSLCLGGGVLSAVKEEIIRKSGNYT